MTFTLKICMFCVVLLKSSYLLISRATRPQDLIADDSVLEEGWQLRLLERRARVWTCSLPLFERTHSEVHCSDSSHRDTKNSMCEIPEI